MNIDNERANFEAWAKSRDMWLFPSCNGVGTYCGTETELAWEAWLARAQSDKAVSVEALEDFITSHTGHCGTLVLNDLRALIAKETGK